MNDIHIWIKVRGLDTEGVRILSDITRLHGGEMNEDEISELMSDLVRDGMVSTAGYAAIPLLIKENDKLSLRTQAEMAHAACLILGFAEREGAPGIDPVLKGNFGEAMKQEALRRLLLLASQEELTSDDLISITSAAFLLKGRHDIYKLLIAKNLNHNHALANE